MLRTLAILGVVVFPMSLAAGEKDKPAGFAKQRSAIGTVLVRPSADKPWTLPELYTPVLKDSQVVVLPGGRGVFETKAGSVWVTLVGNLPELSPLPVLDTALRLHAPEGKDLDFTLDRGRVILENRKDAAGKVVMRVEDKKISID